MLKKSVAIGLVLLGAHAFADTNSATSTSTTKVKKNQNKKADKADELITNQRMRANSGSLSNISMSSSFSYSGGSVQKPLAADRPNIGAAGDNVAVAGLAGSISGTYRLNKLNRVSIGTGLSTIAPFNDSIDTNDENAEAAFDNNKGKIDVADPYVVYTHVNKFMGVQSMFLADVTKITDSSYNDRGYDWSTGVDLNTMYNFGGSRFSVGAYMYVKKYILNTGIDENNNVDGETDMTIGFLPQMEYSLSDTFTLRTIVRSNIYDNSYAERDDFSQRIITQSVGVGISVTRDIYLYPNMQFVVKDMRDDKTNVGISATINI
ncbi:MAG: hypothetical protein QF441_16200 [Bacteriovoracaceae bacterium]|jgi:hypothetical protein|nr:hypothetical protein [Halobacteriovoraceae bacterium]MDP7322147.1 hypothetical protein [Bacteriovoracaceae bacterium]